MAATGGKAKHRYRHTRKSDRDIKQQRRKPVRRREDKTYIQADQRRGLKKTTMTIEERNTHTSSRKIRGNAKTHSLTVTGIVYCMSQQLTRHSMKSSSSPKIGLSGKLEKCLTSCI